LEDAREGSSDVFVVIDYEYCFGCFVRFALLPFSL
jgi:hypothetical protein